MGAERLQNHESGYPNEIPRHNRPFFNSRRCRLQCLVFTVLVVVIHGQQTVIGSTLKNNLLSDIALSGKDDNMLGQVWKKVQEQLAAATRTENRQKPRAKKQDTVANKPKHNPAIKRKEVLDFYANRLQNTTHFHPELLPHAYGNATHHRFTTQLPTFPDAAANRQLIQQMFMHSYDSYMYQAFPDGQEVNPLSCTPGRFGLVELPALTLIDALDTLLILGNTTEFARSVERLRILDENILFSVDQNVSVFETNIRVVGGLLSAHQLALAYFEHHKRPVYYSHIIDGDGNVRIGPVSNATATGRRPQQQWIYDGLLLQLATDIADRLLPAFRTETGIPYGTVNLLDGVPFGETKIASLAGAGTLSLEFALLSALTGVPDYGAKGKLATRALFHRRHSQTNLLGKHLDTDSGQWTESTSGIGSNSDSFYEYLAKHSFVFGNEDTDFWTMFATTYEGVDDFLKNGDWFTDAEMSFGQRGKGVLESLAAFFPGLQASLGEAVPAASSLNQFVAVREALGVLPERYSYVSSSVLGNGYYPLRPELLESIYHMHRATREPGWQWAAHTALQHLHRMNRARCGYAAVVGVKDTTTGTIHASPRSVHQIDEMPSFFLSETLKYLYLTFDDDNFLHTDKDRDWVFTTEAHPIHAVVEEDYVPDIPVVRDILKARLEGKKQKQTHVDPWKYEKWSTKTTRRQVTADIEALNNATSNNANSIFPSDTINRAHRLLGDQGRTLRAACPNQLHHPASLWTRALLGGAVDYTVTTDDFDMTYAQAHDPAIALSSLGQKTISSHTCPVKRETPNKTADEAAQATNELSMFEVSTIGEGFHVRNKVSGQEINVNLVNDNVVLGEDANIGIVYMYTRGTDGTDSGDYNLSVFDFDNNVVSCRLEVLSAKDNTDVLLEIPCCPALFGPAGPERLLSMKSDIVLERKVVAPRPSNRYGCVEPQTPRDFLSDLHGDHELCSVTPTAQLSYRGECSFFTKAENAKDSDVLIVVDSNDDGLFMMSSMKEEALRQDVPISILVTTLDGKALQAALEDSSLVRVSLEKGRAVVDSQGKIYTENPIPWPVVGGDGDTLHVLTAAGWGIRAQWLSQKGSNAAGWELKLVKHG